MDGDILMCTAVFTYYTNITISSNHQIQPSHWVITLSDKPEHSVPFQQALRCSVAAYKVTSDWARSKIQLKTILLNDSNRKKENMQLSDGFYLTSEKSVFS